MTIKEIISQALSEDIGDGDHSSLSAIPVEAHGGAILIAKETGIIAGIDIARQVFQHVDSSTIFHALVNEGDEIQSGDMIFTVEGKSISILSGERVALNFIQRMSGIATRTHHLTSLLNGLNTKLLDTRKTTPLLRELEKYAVRVGGGQNHRFGLFDMIMLKDNHIDFAGGIEKAIQKAVDYLDSTGKDLRIEVETRNLDEVEEVLRVGKIHRIMFDNFSVVEMKEAVALVGGRYETEASGGITEQTLRAYAETGVDFISVGALTHHIKSLDLSLKAIKD
ncbi:MAG: carboxylating nicotinate-nucleotide diphosphorylase [Bacteroidales bacterium]|nr:carboxylating nicotinate-nucleotide diphosphorylase [Bacteroidales bacterium]